MTNPTPHTLTAADIMAHREWRAKHKPGSAFQGSTPPRDVPYITVSPSDGTFYLLGAHGSSVAGSVPGGLSPTALLAMLYNERLEPGWCDSVGDTRLTIEEALRTPSERRAAIERANVAASTARQAKSDELDAARRRRIQLIDPVSKIPAASLTLDDLFS